MDHSGGKQPRPMELESKSQTIARLRRELHASEARFQAIFDKTVDGVIVLSEDGVIRFVNPAAEQLLGRESRSLVGQVFGMPLVPGETSEIDILRPDGPSRVAEMRTVETEWQGKPAHLAALRDITEHKQAEIEAQEAVRRRDRFLAMLSHELRNPLAAVVSASQLIEQASGDLQRVRRANEVIQRQCRQMGRLLDDLLEVSRIVTGKIELRRQGVELVALVKEAVQSVASLVERNRRRFQVRVLDAPLHIHADPARMNQVFGNLLTNAAKYSDDDSAVEIVVERQGDRATVRIKDAGIGIPTDMLESVFEPFVQVNHCLARSDVGLGIGLTLVRQLVELHGGRVSAHSEGAGRGSEFVVQLPLSQAKPTTPPADQPRVDVEDLRIVLIEDNADAREMLRDLLELDGHHVETADDGLKGYELIEYQRPDVALVDVGLPGLDGYEVARRVRAEPANDCVFLIALTGYGQPNDRRRALNAGFDAHLVKPVNLDQLNRLLSEQAQRLATGREPDETTTRRFVSRRRS